MSEKLECNVCKTTYTDKESIDMAKKYAKYMPVESKGISPCPIITCKGEMELKVF